MNIILGMLFGLAFFQPHIQHCQLYELQSQTQVSGQSVTAFDPNAKDQSGLTPLIKAVFSRNYNSITDLLGRGANPNIQDNSGKTALIYAVTNQDIESVRLLLKGNCDVKIKDSTGKNAFDYAKDYGFQTIADLINTSAMTVSPEVTKGRPVDYFENKFRGALAISGIPYEVKDDGYYFNIPINAQRSQLVVMLKLKDWGKKECDDLMFITIAASTVKPFNQTVLIKLLEENNDGSYCFWSFRKSESSGTFLILSTRFAFPIDPFLMSVRIERLAEKADAKEQELTKQDKY